ncbi:MAG: hypothetical protein IBX72_09100 [Nitrospirae bacterium]|jgi:hypothetical protein|nr:hypothetical protein [Nitrospirota bacterium]
MVEIGKIKKPEAEDYADKRKLYCVANIYTIEEAPDDFKQLVNRYWDEVVQQIDKLEAAGKTKKIFCEIIYQPADEALDILSKINERISQIIKKKLEEGGTLFPLEKEEIIGPYTDWSNCLRIVYTEEVFKKIIEFYTEISNKRLQHILEVIDLNLSESEAGLLIMKDEDRAKLQFPGDIEVFLITPPSYDDIIRWFREKLGRKSQEKE